MKRTTKKERQQLEAEKAAVLEQFDKWISAKSQVSLIYQGPFFSVVVEGNLVRDLHDANRLEFLALQTPLRVSISLNHCASYRYEDSHKNVLVWLEGLAGFDLAIAERMTPRLM